MFSIFINGFTEHFCQWKEEILLEDKKANFDFNKDFKQFSMSK